MHEQIAQAFDATRDWFERMIAAGWLAEGDRDRLATVEQAAPEDLFTDATARPLVVALFGGTGVGKSSLLNRLAGQPLARVGVERPTSREVTLYVHEQVELAELPDDLPVAQVEIKRHTNDEYRDVLWIDAPDIDSTEPANRRAALAWLPHVDLVCYVVSPERYRDDVGWRVLRERGHKHGWMFLLNRWDEGDAAQVADLERILADAGFDEPVVLPTACRPGATLPSPDQFDTLRATLRALRDEHGARELARLGQAARLAELRAAIDHVLPRFGDDATWGKLSEALEASWDRTAETIRSGAAWSLQATAGRFAVREGSVLEKLSRQLRPPALQSKKEQPPETAPDNITVLDDLTGRLWDEWSQSKLQACLDESEVLVRRRQILGGPLSTDLNRVAESAGGQVTGTLHDAVRAAFAKPGNWLTRVGRRVTGFLMVSLPAVALLWVAFKVVETYRHAKVPSDFLGIEFAVHSGLLVLLAWGVPYAIDRLLRPSLEKLVLGALERGLDEALAALGSELKQAFSGAVAGAADQRQEAIALRERIQELRGGPTTPSSATVARLVSRVSA
jgi:hypothetical protein